METEEFTKQTNKDLFKNKIHKVLAYSYLVYFISFFVGLLLDFIFPSYFFNKNILVFIGTLFLIFGTLLIFWAQRSSLNLSKDNLTKESFSHGPYFYTRSPTHFGIFLLMLGFGIMSSGFFVVIFSVIAFLITKFIFLKKEEDLLVQKYGTPYLEYKNKVKF